MNITIIKIVIKVCSFNEHSSHEFNDREKEILIQLNLKLVWRRSDSYLVDYDVTIRHVNYNTKLTPPTFNIRWKLWFLKIFGFEKN